MSAVQQDVIHVLLPDKAEIIKALDALFDPADVIELRAFHKGRKRTDAGYFDTEHRDKLVAEAVRLSNAGAAVYVTLNRLDPQLLGHYANRIEQFAQATTTDANVTRRRWLLLDFDPKKPKDTSATDEQLKAAKDCARKCLQALRAEPWPKPLIAESGNGIHLLYRLDLPNDSESDALIEGALAGLAQRFDTERVNLYKSAHNAGRIIKLYGTVAIKGDHTPIAPWHLSKLVSVPARGQVVMADQLRALHSPAEPQPINGTPPHHSGSFNLEEFLSRLGIAYTQDIHSGSERYKLDHCPFNPEHGKGEAAIFRGAGGKLGFRCQHNSCADKHWQDVRELVDGPPETRTKTSTGHSKNSQTDAEAEAETPHKSQANKAGLDFTSLSDLLAEPDEQTPWLVDGLLPQAGLSIIAARPKVGKSTLARTLTLAVARGEPFLDLDTTAGTVLYLALEEKRAELRRQFKA
ncbi:MAG TPA: AAA family ATPase, partial [Gammaproteobacteria bacterium]|nr:AAA family ATPase [Gammaproteobacteria bacterium]